MKKNCDCCVNGKCKRHEGICKPSTIDWFYDKLDVCNINEVCRKQSVFGNSFIVLSDKDIELLKSGKILYSIDEYGTFIGYKGDKE